MSTTEQTGWADSRAVRVVLALMWLGSFYALLFAVFTGRPGLFGTIGGGVGVIVAGLWRDRDFHRLPAPQRRRVRAVERGGEPTGDDLLDRLALTRLERASRTVRSDRVVLPMLLVAVVALIVVAVAHRGAWWLVAGVPCVALGSRLAWEPWRDDPRPRLIALRTAMNAD